MLIRCFQKNTADLLFMLIFLVNCAIIISSTYRNLSN